MRNIERIQAESKAELCAWLEANQVHVQSESLVTFEVHIPGRFVSYDEMVKESLCLNWMDISRSSFGSKHLLKLPVTQGRQVPSFSSVPPGWAMQ